MYMIKKINIAAGLCIVLSLTAQGPKGFEGLVVHKTHATLNKIKEIITNKQKGMYLRFGDGELVVALGQGAIEQNPNQRLAVEMQEAFALNGPTILKTIPLYCREFGGWEPGMFLPSNHEETFASASQHLNSANKLWNAPITDVYSHVALHFASTTYTDDCIQFLKFLKSSNCCLFVGNRNIPQQIRDLLFGPECIFIPTAPHSCYDDIDNIEQEVLNKLPNKNEYKVIVTCMGPSSKALQKRLWPKIDNVFLFDFGSLMDAICGWNTRWWIKDTHFDAQNFLTLLSKN